MNDIRTRIDIVSPLTQLLKNTTRAYQLGQMKSSIIIPEGYQELNILLITTLGKYVVKIFSKEKSLKRIQDNIWGYVTFRKQGVPMPALQKTNTNEYLFPIAGVNKTSYLCVMEYIDGNYLQPQDATDDDILRLTNYMMLIHTNINRIGRYYDSMGVANFLSQFKKFNRYLNDADSKQLHLIVEQYSSLPIKQFRRCITHGTFESENILKRGNELCLLDLGCMDYNAAVYDIATFIANFTLDLPSLKTQRRMSIITTQCQQTFPLSPSELRALPTLVRAQFATIYLRTNYYRTKLHDSSKLTMNWYHRAKRGLEQWSSL